MKYQLTPAEKKLVRIAWIVGLLVLSAIVVVELFMHHHAHFEKDGITIDTLPEFYPIYGFGASFVLVVFAKTLAIALKRKDTFYADD